MIITWLLALLLFVSVLANILLLWYCKKLLNYLSLTNTDARNMLASMNNFEDHLKDVYNREVFYGEPVLESLLKHTAEIMDEVEQFVKIGETSIMEPQND